MSKLIQCQKLCKYYQMGQQTVKALDGIDLTVEKGEYIAILGSSGSGKSTLMNLLGCLDRPTSGGYWLEGEEISQLPIERLAQIRNQKIGFVFQGFHLLPYLNARDNVAMPLMYRKVPPHKRNQQANLFLEKVGLAHRGEHLPRELSGGEQQRVAVARALVTEPTLILADEPTGNLDSQAGQQIMRLFEEVITHGHTVLVVTHDEHLAKKIPRTIRLKDGRLTSKGAT